MVNDRILIKRLETRPHRHNHNSNYNDYYCQQDKVTEKELYQMINNKKHVLTTQLD